jgi:protein TonB
VSLGCTSYHDSSDTYYQEKKNEDLRSQEYKPEVSIDLTRSSPSALDGAPLDTPPVLVKHTIPEYPILALRAGIDGDIRFGVVVGVDGLVQEIEVISSNSTYTMELSSKEAIREFVYEPGILDGAPVASKVEISVYFTAR